MSEQPANQSKSIHTGGGSFIEGGVETGGGDFTGRDKITQVLGDEVHGDKVGGNKVTIGTLINNLFNGNSEDVRKLRNRQAMLKLVHDIWVKGILEHSLYNQLLIDLDIEQYPEAVERPWDMIVQVPEQARHLLPRGTKISTIFAEVNQSLLILGEPGSGKTTMLLELARVLIEQAERNVTLPIPVIFNLSSWAEQRAPIRQWLIGELRTKYYIPKFLATGWVEEESLVLLLDGLDEVKHEYQDECINALNQFQQESKTLVPLAICSRIAAYATLTSKLGLRGAVALHPLTTEQIHAFLDLTGDKLLAVRKLLGHDPTLYELAQSPLTLTIMTVAYSGKSIEELQSLESMENRRRQMFAIYIEKMFERRSARSFYSKSQTIKWLTWLAKQFVKSQQFDRFLIEKMQPDLLSSQLQKYIYAGSVIMISACIVGIFAWLAFPFDSSIVSAAQKNYAIGLGFTLGLAICLKTIKLRGILGGLLLGVASGIISGLAFGYAYNSLIGLMVGTAAGLTVSVIFAFTSRRLASGTTQEWTNIDVVEKLDWSWRRALPGLLIGSAGGFLFGWVVGQAVWWPISATVGLAFSIASGLTVGVINGIQGGEVATKTVPNQGVWQSAEKFTQVSIAIALSTGIPIGTLIGYAWGILPGKTADRLVVGMMTSIFIGLAFGVGIGLFYGGQTVIKHVILRLLLYHSGYIPLNYSKFLDYCADRIFLRKVGGGYIFVHRLLMEHFASLTEEDIKRLAE